MKTMNERDKNEMLNAIAGEGETYQCRLWGTIMADAKTYARIGGLSPIAGSGAAALGALSNAYCYLGMTEKNINFVIIDSIDVSKVKNRLSVPVGNIGKAEVKKGLIPGRTTVILHIENTKMKLILMNNTVGSDIKGQKENVEKFCQLVKNI